MELTRYCQNCKKEVEIDQIETVNNSETITLNCGHKHISHVIQEKLKLRVFISHKLKNPKGGLIEKYKEKISGETKKDTIEIIKIDRGKKLYIHEVKEKMKGGNWKVVHSEKIPFSQQHLKDIKKKKPTFM